MNKYNIIFSFLGILISILGTSQENDSIKKLGGFDIENIIKNEAKNIEEFNDSIFITLNTIKVQANKLITIDSADYDSDYHRKVKMWIYKVYPYYQRAMEEYYIVQDSVLSRKDSKDRKIIRERQKKLSEEYKDKLKKLSRNNARMFAKLIYRETDKTAFEVIKELKGGWSAFWWNTKASTFKIDLKNTYDPVKYREDLYIEYILREAFLESELKKLRK